MHRELKIKVMTIADLHTEQTARVIAVGGEGALRKHFLDMGIIPGVRVTHVKTAPMGDPMEILLRGYSLSLRREDAAAIEVEPVAADGDKEALDALSSMGYLDSLHEHNSHPGYGESGKYHSKQHESPLPKGTELTFAIVGQHNCGKTALFNRLTGENRHIGNFPGVTVDVNGGKIRGYKDAEVFDLPGIYSFSTCNENEIVARNFVLSNKPKAIINVVDAGNIERNLYLTMQLMELEIPMVLALNMMDELHSSGGSVRVNEMERILGLPVVPISASKGYGVDELVEHAMHIAKFQEKPRPIDFCDKDYGNGAVHRCIHAIMHLVEDHAQMAGIPLRFAAVRLVEGDSEILAKLALSGNEKDMLDYIISQMEQESGLDKDAVIADMRFSFIANLCSKTVVKPNESAQHKLSRRIDKVLTGRWTAIPVFLATICAAIWLTVDVIGAWLQGLLASGINALASVVDTSLVQLEVSDAVRSLVVDAIFGGVGRIVSFIPVIIVMFFFLSLLEDSGYMSRIAFLSDKLLRKVGLSGRSIVPLLIGFGCTVPGVMATRTLPSAHDRRLTVMLIPYMSCSAKIPLYAFLTSAFFPGRGGLALVCLYLFGIVVGMIVALLKKLLTKGYDPSPFVMELPVYRLPNMKNLAHLIWDKTKDFLQMAFSVIFIATLVIWFLQTFDASMNMVADAGDSILAKMAGLIAPAFAPLGLGDWRIVTALISGFLAKESVVSTLGVLGGEALLTATTAVPMLVFCLLYTPCVAAIAAVKRELGRGWAALMVVFQCVVAWVCAFLAYMIVL